MFSVIRFICVFAICFGLVTVESIASRRDVISCVREYDVSNHDFVLNAAFTETCFIKRQRDSLAISVKFDPHSSLYNPDHCPEMFPHSASEFRNVFKQVCLPFYDLSESAKEDVQLYNFVNDKKISKEDLTLEMKASYQKAVEHLYALHKRKLADEAQLLSDIKNGQFQRQLEFFVPLPQLYENSSVGAKRKRVDECVHTSDSTDNVSMQAYGASIIVVFDNLATNSVADDNTACTPLDAKEEKPVHVKPIKKRKKRRRRGQKKCTITTIMEDVDLKNDAGIHVKVSKAVTNIVDAKDTNEVLVTSSPSLETCFTAHPPTQEFVPSLYIDRFEDLDDFLIHVYYSIEDCFQVQFLKQDLVNQRVRKSHFY